MPKSSKNPNENQEQEKKLSEVSPEAIVEFAEQNFPNLLKQIEIDKTFKFESDLGAVEIAEEMKWLKGRLPQQLVDAKFKSLKNRVWDGKSEDAIRGELIKGVVGEIADIKSELERRELAAGPETRVAAETWKPSTNYGIDLGRLKLGKIGTALAVALMAVPATAKLVSENEGMSGGVVSHTGLAGSSTDLAVASHHQRSLLQASAFSQITSPIKNITYGNLSYIVGAIGTPQGSKVVMEKCDLNNQVIDNIIFTNGQSSTETPTDAVLVDPRALNLTTQQGESFVAALYNSDNLDADGPAVGIAIAGTDNMTPLVPSPGGQGVVVDQTPRVSETDGRFGPLDSNGTIPIIVTSTNRDTSVVTYNNTVATLRFFGNRTISLIRNGLESIIYQPALNMSSSTAQGSSTSQDSSTSQGSSTAQESSTAQDSSTSQGSSTAQISSTASAPEESSSNKWLVPTVSSVVPVSVFLLAVGCYCWKRRTREEDLGVETGVPSTTVHNARLGDGRNNKLEIEMHSV